MTVEKMNVHQALAELKTLDKRIEKAIDMRSWVVVNKHSNSKIGGLEIGEWVKDCRSDYDRVMDLIRRRDAIKRAVVNSNAVTKVLIAGVEYTVAEAIDKKNHGTQFLSLMARRLASDYMKAEMAANRENDSRLEERADAYVRSLIGNTDMKGATDEVKRLRDEFIKAQTVDIIDPMDSRKEIARLEEEVSSFLTNVDAALSTSNATTEITVEY